MKIIVNREELAEAVVNLSRAAMTKSTAEVMEGILFSADAGRLDMFAYNLELAITKTMYVQVEEPGDVVLNARLFGDIIRKIPGTIVTITVDEKLKCRIESESTKFDIIGMNAADFPEMPTFGNGTEFKIEGTVLRDMIRQTVFSAALVETTKPIFTGLSFEVNSGVLDVVAVDGFRIAVRKEEIGQCPDLNFVIPAKSVGETAKIITDKTEEVTVVVGNQHVCFKIDGYTLIARLLDGKFMNYRASIKDSYITEVTCSVREISDIIERISLLISESMKKPIRFHITGDKIEFSCTTAIGRADDELVVSVKGDNIEIGVNNKYLLDALRASETDEIILKFNGPTSPILIEPSEGNSFVYMIMPMLINAGESNNE